VSGTRVLERRGRLGRGVQELWRRWDAAPPRWLSLLTPLTTAVAAADLRRRLSGRAAPPPSPRVISVGALATGGSGKTPVVLDLAARLLDAGRGVAVVTRGYGSADRGPLRVEARDACCGDEARLLAARLPGAKVVQARDRRAGLDLLRSLPDAPGLVILEDGHQCAGQGRHLDLLILDRWCGTPGGVVPETGLRLPWGPYREGASGAARAAVWLLPLAPGETLPSQPDTGPTLLGFERRVALPEGVATPLDMPYGVVCGIAAPERFEAACTSLCGPAPALAARFDDHAAYDRGDVADVLAAGEAAGLGAWLTTAKDRVKLASLWPAHAPPLHEVGLDLAWRDGADPARAVLEHLEA